MDFAGLHDGPGPDRLHRVWQALEPVADEHEHVADAALLDLDKRDLLRIARLVASRQSQLVWWATQPTVRTVDPQPWGCGSTVSCSPGDELGEAHGEVQDSEHTGHPPLDPGKRHVARTGRIDVPFS